MRFATRIMVALAVVPAALQAPGDSGSAATNCGFLTIEQRRATLTGGSSFCVPNQFYNPHGPTKRTRSRQEGRRYTPTPPTILIRGAPFYRTPVTKTSGAASLERLRDGLVRLRWIIAFPASERSFKLLS